MQRSTKINKTHPKLVFECRLNVEINLMVDRSENDTKARANSSEESL